jgi:hypothetical protein
VVVVVVEGVSGRSVLGWALTLSYRPRSAEWLTVAGD